MKTMHDEWVFYLKLSPKLDDKFIFIDSELKNYGLSLIPIDFKSLCEVTKNSYRANIIVIVSNFRDLAYYNRYVKKLMKMMIVSQRVQLFHVSSFSDCNHFDLGKRNNYHNYELPIAKSFLCQEIISQIMDTPEVKNLWPGGKSPRITMER
jgi:sensor histidine kinase YesM